MSFSWMSKFCLINGFLFCALMSLEGMDAAGGRSRTEPATWIEWSDNRIDDCAHVMARCLVIALQLTRDGAVLTAKGLYRAGCAAAPHVERAGRYALSVAQAGLQAAQWRAHKWFHRADYDPLIIGMLERGNIIRLFGDQPDQVIMTSIDGIQFSVPRSIALQLLDRAPYVDELIHLSSRTLFILLHLFVWEAETDFSGVSWIHYVSPADLESVCELLKQRRGRILKRDYLEVIDAFGVFVILADCCSQAADLSAALASTQASDYLLGLTESFAEYCLNARADWMRCMRGLVF